MDDHYFTADPAVAFKRAPVEATVWGHDLPVTSGSGVFAQGRLDIGTAVLFRETEPPAARTHPRPRLRLRDDRAGRRHGGPGRRGDAGSTSTSGRCCWRTRTPPRSGWPTGSRRCCRTRCRAEATYDEIWSNPPIRIGKDALHALLLTWLPRLAPGGRAVMVVGKNLGADSLQRWLGEQGYPTERLASAKGFRVPRDPDGPRCRGCVRRTSRPPAPRRRAAHRRRCR